MKPPRLGESISRRIALWTGAHFSIPASSFILCWIDKRRIRRIFGQVSSSELAGIDQGLELFLGLG